MFRAETLLCRKSNLNIFVLVFKIIHCLSNRLVSTAEENGKAQLMAKLAARPLTSPHVLSVEMLRDLRNLPGKLRFFVSKISLNWL